MSIQSYDHVLKQTHISQNQFMSKDTREHTRTRARTHTHQVKSLEAFPQACTLRLPPAKDIPLGRPSLRPDGGIFQLSPGPADPALSAPPLVEGGLDVAAVLQPGAAATFYVSFCPRAPRAYACSLQVWPLLLVSVHVSMLSSCHRHSKGPEYSSLH